jgi:hypothetical protein
LYFPKASLFQDKTEGKWWGHAHLFENAEKWRRSPANVNTLDELLERAGQDPSAILREIDILIPTANEWVRNMLVIAKRAYPHKRREFIENTISSWKRQYADHNQSVEQWKSDIAIERECTYISCWNRASSMSLAMWEMYGGGRESVAVRCSLSKLDGLITNSTSFLEEQGLEGAVAAVEYIDGLKSPNEDVQEQICQIMFERDRDYRVGLFAIKPSVYEFEQEVRAILYPKREVLSPIEDAHPDLSGLHLPIAGSEPKIMQTIPEFIEKVYVHPMLSEDSMMVQTIKEINRQFGVSEIPVVANKIEAMGTDVVLPPLTRK